MNRIVTLVGRSELCKIHLNADDISPYHCGLVLTPAGLWVVDLSGRGVVVSGERMRAAPLGQGAELWVGRFLIGCHYPAGLPSPPPSSTPPPGVTPPVRGARNGAAKTPIVIPEDEVPLGQQPANDPVTGLPSSHIMADAFRTLLSGPISNPILVSTGSNPSPPPIPVPATHRPITTEAGPPTEPILRPTGSPANQEGPVVPLLRLFAEIQGQMFEQFQQSMLLMVQVFGQLHREQTAVLQQELTHIQELNAELAKLQTEVARLTLARAFSGPAPSDQTPIPGSPGTAPQAAPPPPNRTRRTPRFMTGDGANRHACRRSGRAAGRNSLACATQGDPRS